MAKKKKRKKVIIIIIIVLILAVLLVPLPVRNKDGGTVKYKAVLWSYTDYHTLADELDENGKYVRGFEVGYKLEIVGTTVSEERHFEEEHTSDIVYKELNQDSDIQEEDVPSLEQKYKDELIEKQISKLDQLSEEEREKYRDMLKEGLGQD